MDTLSESFIDLRMDFAELYALISDYYIKLTRYNALLNRQKEWCNFETKQLLFHFGNHLLDQLQSLKNDTRLITQKTFSNSSPIDLEQLISQKCLIKEKLRCIVGVIGQTIAATDWQSPSFLASGKSQAGRQTAKIHATINDYKRDLHLDAVYYEELFLKSYIDATFKLPIKIYTTSSGQAAFTTVLTYLIGENLLTGPVLVGENIYFENDWLIKKLLKNRFVVIPETSQAIAKALEIHRSSALIIDSLSNTQLIQKPELNSICKVISGFKKPFSFIVDNTGQATGFQLFKHFSSISNILQIIGFESLNKYHQFGMDRVTGGIIYATGQQIGKLSDYRVHLGTNITDTGALTLPLPNRSLLDKRLKRHQRNTFYLATKLHTAVSNGSLPKISQVNYPGLQSTGNNSKQFSQSFFGSYLTLSFHKKYQSIPSYKLVVNKVITQAKKQKVQIISGTSFGLDTTRIYLTAIRACDISPYIRISVGTECMWEMEKLSEVFITALS